VQASCSQCGQRIAVDDARAPDRPFGVRCPKCQATVRFPGRAAAAADPSPAAPAASQRQPPATPPAAQPRAPLPPPPPATEQPGERGAALVSFDDEGVADKVTEMLTRIGYTVDKLAEQEAGSRRLEQGFYKLSATQRSSEPDALYSRVTRLAAEARREVLLVLVGDEFQSGESIQAFTAQADLVLHTQDAGNADNLVRSTVTEHEHLFAAFREAQRRLEEASHI